MPAATTLPIMMREFLPGVTGVWSCSEVRRAPIALKVANVCTLVPALVIYCPGPPPHPPVSCVGHTHGNS